MDLSENAKLLHSRMIALPSSTLFGQEDLQKFLNTTKSADLLEAAQELINKKLLKLVKQGDELKFQATSMSEASKITSMSEDEAMIYSHIEASGREGIWTKTLKAKTNLHQHIVVRCLKSLESQRYIKSIKSVKHPTRKIYMLYNLQPSIEVTGGPWFTDSELDTEFIDSLLKVVWRFIASKSYPTVFQAPSPNVNIMQASFPTTHSGFASLPSIVDFIANANITTVDLAISDVRSLCEVLIYDDKIEPIEHMIDTYKVTWMSILEAGYGRDFENPSNETFISPKLKSLAAPKHFSIFDSYSVIDSALADDKDLVYFDSWIYE